MKKIYIYIILVFIVLGAGFLRIYKLDKVPASLNWDEVAAGYNAYTIANWGKDEWGKSFPLVFTSFKDDKHPVHIYITAAFVKVFGLSDFNVRLSSATVGILTVLLMYFLAKKIFDNELSGIFAALFLAISSYHLQFSRGLWEVNFALFFYILGLTLFLYGIKNKKWLLPFSFFSFGLSFFSYHSSKVLVPPTILLLVILNFKSFYENRKYFFISIFVIGLFVLLTVLNLEILGFARAKQNKFSEKELAGTQIYDKTHNNTLAFGEIVLKNYVKYFDPNYLFFKGDQNPRNSVKVVGEFYKVDMILILIGLIAMLTKPKSTFLIIALWIILAPLPGALSSQEPNAARGLFMMGSFHLIAAYGAYSLLKLSHNKFISTVVLLIILVPLGFEFGNYLKYYYTVYPKKDAIEWQYGMKEVVAYMQKRDDVYKVYMDKIRQQPYIFFLYYLKIPLPQLLKTVKYDQTESKSYNTILSFDRYQFGGWDPIQSTPNRGILYAITPSYYSGLFYINSFSVDKLIKYPDGADAFYIVEGDQ